jgi:hypothetical protein
MRAGASDELAYSLRKRILNHPKLELRVFPEPAAVDGGDEHSHLPVGIKTRAVENGLVTQMSRDTSKGFD